MSFTILQLQARRAAQLPSRLLNHNAELLAEHPRIGLSQVHSRPDPHSIKMELHLAANAPHFRHVRIAQHPVTLNRIGDVDHPTGLGLQALRGVVCQFRQGLCVSDEPDPPKQEICCSRMFGIRLTELPPIKEAVATYMMRASEKLRAQKSLCKKVRVCIRTGMFNPEEAKYANGVVVDMPYPTDDVRLLTQAAVGALDRIFRPGFKYSKAEVMLLNLCQSGEYTDDLFAISQPAEATRVMTVMDQINERWGRGALRSACVPADPDWGMRRDMMSQSYTTKLDQLWSVACR